MIDFYHKGRLSMLEARCAPVLIFVTKLLDNCPFPGAFDASYLDGLLRELCACLQSTTKSNQQQGLCPVQLSIEYCRRFLSNPHPTAVACGRIYDL